MIFVFLSFFLSFFFFLFLHVAGVRQGFALSLFLRYTLIAFLGGFRFWPSLIIASQQSGLYAFDLLISLLFGYIVWLTVDNTGASIYIYI